MFGCDLFGISAESAERHGKWDGGKLGTHSHFCSERNKKAPHGVRVGSWDEIHQSTAEANAKSPGCKEEASYNMKHSQQKNFFR